MKFGVITFPGSNSDHDSYSAVKYALGEEVEYIWHQDTELSDFDCVILPGGFSYGDYLRSGAIAQFSPIMQAVKRFAADGGFVVGICNGFQILVESGLLPGALIRNSSLRFLGQFVHLRVENNETAFTNCYAQGQVIRVPIAHADGNYFATPETLDVLEQGRQVVFRYCDPNGELTSASNVNGSLHAIAGIMNEAGNVFGMMPHPERATDAILTSTEGLGLFESIRATVKGSNQKYQKNQKTQKDQKTGNAA
ncbi:phosphoribosylformylglycinamidine synthase subunit PurQ [Gemmatimonas aurantiaca]|nr:phosphoribosylformylglycinamidine synthase subunit PurQ [Gemmatimonas aurantiaca]